MQHYCHKLPLSKQLVQTDAHNSVGGYIVYQHHGNSSARLIQTIQFKFDSLLAPGRPLNAIETN